MRRTWPDDRGGNRHHAGHGCSCCIGGCCGFGRGGTRRVRVNQVGYPSDGPKVAYVMLARPVSTVSFEVTTPYGVAYRGTSTDDWGRGTPRTARSISSASPG